MSRVHPGPIYTWGVLRPCRVAVPLLLFVNVAASAQTDAPQNQPTQPPTRHEPRPAPTVPRMPAHSLKGYTVPADPDNPKPAARDFNDPLYRVSFHIPAGWNFEKRDGVISNFGVETRTARARSQVRGVAEISFNPWPPTTFAGALFYYSVIPHSTAATCVAQTATKGMRRQPDTEVGGIAFHHGRDQHGSVCTEARDDAFTAMRGTACMRFDLVVNTFCSDTSGAQEITPDQLQDVQTRLAGILGSVKIGR